MCLLLSNTLGGRSARTRKVVSSGTCLKATRATKTKVVTAYAPCISTISTKKAYYWQGTSLRRAPKEIQEKCSKRTSLCT